MRACIDINYRYYYYYYYTSCMYTMYYVGNVYRRRSSIRIVRAMTSDSGEYWCQADNVLGTFISTPIAVTVDPPGTIC